MATFTTETNSKAKLHKTVEFTAEKLTKNPVKGYLYTDENDKKIIKLIVRLGNNKYSFMLTRDGDELNVNIYTNFSLGNKFREMLKAKDDDEGYFDGLLRDKAESLYGLTYADAIIGVKSEWTFRGVSRIASEYPDTDMDMLIVGDFFKLEGYPTKIDLVEILNDEEFQREMHNVILKLNKVKPMELVTGAFSDWE